MENQRKQEEMTTAKQELDRAKLTSSINNLINKRMEQNEELAELRAETSLREARNCKRCTD